MAGEQAHSRKRPFPDQEKKSVNDLMTSVFFMSEDRWNECREQGIFDYVVIGSSFCAWAFTQRVLEKNPKAKILILERGEYNYLEHFKDLSPTCKRDLTYDSKTCQWNTTKRMKEEEYIKELDKMNNFLGGKSAFWRAWCPQPRREELHGWPESVKDAILEYFPQAQKLLNVVSADKISEQKCGNADHHPVFGNLQTVLVTKIKSCPSNMKNYRVDHASFAVRAYGHSCERIQKTSVADPLLDLAKNHQALEIKIGCEVKKIKHKGGKAVALETSIGDIKLGNAKLILAMGVLPPTALMLNSFEEPAKIGTRFTAHFRSSILARIPLQANPQSVYHDLREKISGRVEVAAMHISRLKPVPEHQFHIQLSAILDGTDDMQTKIRQFPDVLPEVLVNPKYSSKEHIIIACKTIGGLDRDNKDNWFCLNSKVPDDETCISSNNVTTLQAVTNKKDLQLWETMKESTYEVLKSLRDDLDSCQLEYWHHSEKKWLKDSPPLHDIRRESLVHAASTMWIGDDKDKLSPVNLDYEFRIVKNVYLTGGALWPAAGSLNPTCIMTALAMHLADKLSTNH